MKIIKGNINLFLILAATSSFIVLAYVTVAELLPLDYVTIVCIPVFIFSIIGLTIMSHFPGYKEKRRLLKVKEIKDALDECLIEEDLKWVFELAMFTDHEWNKGSLELVVAKCVEMGWPRSANWSADNAERKLHLNELEAILGVCKEKNRLDDVKKANELIAAL